VCTESPLFNPCQIHGFPLAEAPCSPARVLKGRVFQAESGLAHPCPSLWRTVSSPVLQNASSYTCPQWGPLSAKLSAAWRPSLLLYARSNQTKWKPADSCPDPQLFLQYLRALRDFRSWLISNPRPALGHPVPDPGKPDLKVGWLPVFASLLDRVRPSRLEIHSRPGSLPMDLRRRLHRRSDADVLWRSL
jgi:hypothetical protein